MSRQYRADGPYAPFDDLVDLQKYRMQLILHAPAAPLEFQPFDLREPHAEQETYRRAMWPLVYADSVITCLRAEHAEGGSPSTRPTLPDIPRPVPASSGRHPRRPSAVEKAREMAQLALAGVA